ncbi:signal recognition particle protein [Helicobacter sp. 16-1353]|uniref:signal recognition particle protein n=1 Tax=Helicobacter sp. 16-1353 TaxID=2004996 RepID=UPI000DCE9F79|nr:signal recognition particle protein [Helicobacter sp. 16-1353]RAX52067.1 signal recognition particle protein [Helicobacter sp. 16-1353]
MFDTLTSSFKGIVNKIRFLDDEKALNRSLDELKKVLLKNDVYHKVVKEIIAQVEIECKKNGIGKDSFANALKDSLNAIFSGTYGFTYAPKPPTIVLMVGLQGSGKTTSSAKLANYLKLRGKKVLLVGCDLQRLAAVEQLRQLASEIEVDFYFKENLDSIKLARESIRFAQDSSYDVVIVDTAGRLAINTELMSELKNLKSEVKANETFYVLDSLSGQDAVRSADTFNKEIGLSGVVLSKFDSDSKGGIALSVTKQINVPIRFIGSGEKVADLDIFLPERIVGRLMGAGDIAGFIEKTTIVVDEKQAKQITQKIKKGNFTFTDFLNQLESIKKMGSMKSLISMMPGLGAMGDALKNVDIDNSVEIKNLKAMVSSMTKKERENPSILNGSRKKRIAKGCGLDVSDINRSLKQFETAAKMAKQMSSPNGVKNIMNMVKGANLNKMR